MTIPMAALYVASSEPCLVRVPLHVPYRFPGSPVSPEKSEIVRKPAAHHWHTTFVPAIAVCSLIFIEAAEAVMS